MKRAMKNALVLLMCVALAGCGGLPVALPGQSQTPATIKIVEPASGATAKLGEATPVKSEYAGSVAAIRLVVNGAEVAVEPAANSALTLSWSPLDAGQNVLYLEALDAERKSIARSELVFVQVSAPQPTAAPSPTEAPLPTTAPQPTAAPTTSPITLTTTTTQTTSSLSPSLTITNEFANLRAGPDTNFELVGKLNQGQTASVLGKSADGKWWQIKNGAGVAWVFGELVQVNAAANGVAVAQAPALPTKPPATATPIQPTATAALVALAPTAAPATAAPTAIPANPDEPPCNPDNPYWGHKLNPDSPWYTFCTPVHFEFVNSGNPDEVQVRWHIYGDFVDLELRMDPSGDSCGMGSSGFRQKVNRKEDNFRINKKNLPSGGYKLGLFITFADGRVQDWGELHFCGG
jgi:hypothetical protein